MLFLGHSWSGTLEFDTMMKQPCGRRHFRNVIGLLLLLVSNIASSTDDRSMFGTWTKEDLFQEENESGQISNVLSDRRILQQLLQSEEDVAPALQQYVAREKEKLAIIEWYIRSYEEFRRFKMAVRLDHPIISYKAIKHFSYNWNLVNTLIGQGVDDSRALLVQILQQRHDFEALKADCYEAASNIHRIQVTYNLSIDSLADGTLQTGSNRRYVETDVGPLNAFDCLQISLGAADNNCVQEAKEWLDQAYIKLSSGDESADEDYLRHQQEQLEIKMNHESDEASEIRLLKTMTDGELKTYLNRKKDIGTKIQDELFHRVCRQELELPHQRLRCRFETNDVPYLKIRPLKLEELSKKPKIEIVHDLVNEYEIREFLALSAAAGNEMEISMVTSDSNSSSRIHDIGSRNGVNTWVKDEDSAILRQVTKKIEYFSGMRASDTDQSSEQYQVASYPPAGRYIPHYDAFEDPDRLHPSGFPSVCGDRIATLMIYLSDVPVGGATAFPLVGVSVKPEKGAGVLWYNVDKKGSLDKNTSHGGCPVLYGSKLIANKWFCANAQMFKKPCSLIPEDYF